MLTASGLTSAPSGDNVDCRSSVGHEPAVGIIISPGQVVSALQHSEVAEQRRDIGTGVFIAAVNSDQGVEQQEAGAKVGKARSKAVLIALEVEAQRRAADDVQVEGGDVELPVVADGLDTIADRAQGILGHVEQDGTLALDGKVPESQRSGGDACG